MLTQAVDFRAEADALHAVLGKLAEADWDRATTFKSWTINDVIQHLHWGDLMAASSVAGPEHFARFRADMTALRDRGMNNVAATRVMLEGLTGAALGARWHATMVDLCDQLTAMPPDTRLKWAGPDMGVRMFTTARQMETWAHGQEIYDLMGVAREPTQRLRNIAEIGVRTYGWTFVNRGMELPGPAPSVTLDGPDGEIWQWHDRTPDNCITGSAVEFCQVVTQVRNIADTSLQVTGSAATEWMRIAQCFAGPPETPPTPGSRAPKK